jgi:hypothetical protein
MHQTRRLWRGVPLHLTVGHWLLTTGIHGVRSGVFFVYAFICTDEGCSMHLLLGIIGMACLPVNVPRHGAPAHGVERS